MKATNTIVSIRSMWFRSIMLILVSASASTARAQTSATIACGETRVDRIEHRAGQRCHTFAGREADVALINVAWMETTSGDFNPDWRIYGPDGALLNPPPYYACGGWCETGKLPVTGTYTVLVYDDGSDATGRYSISLRGVSATLNGQPSCGEAIACGQTLVREISGPGPSEVAAFHFTARAEDVALINVAWMETTSGDFNPDWRIYGPDGALLNPPPYYACGGWCETGKLPVTGTYTVLVYDDGSDATGRYSISLRGVSATFNGQPSCGEAIACGQTLVREISGPGPSEVAAFHFTARAEDVALINVAWMETLSGDFNPDWRIYGPDGALLNPPPYYACGGWCETGKLPVTGTYTVLVYDDGADATGVYELSMRFTAPSECECRSASECASDADCDDGNFCNGRERCFAGRCRPGPRPCGDVSNCDDSGICIDYCIGDSDGDGACDPYDACPFNSAPLGSDPSGRPLGDLKQDCDVDLRDLRQHVSAILGPNQSRNDPAADLDGDCDADLRDFQHLQVNFTGRRVRVRFDPPSVVFVPSQGPIAVKVYLEPAGLGGVRDVTLVLRSDAAWLDRFVFDPALEASPCLPVRSVDTTPVVGPFGTELVIRAGRPSPPFFPTYCSYSSSLLLGELTFRPDDHVDPGVPLRVDVYHPQSGGGSKVRIGERGYSLFGALTLVWI